MGTSSRHQRACHRRRPRRPDHLARPRTADRLPDRAACRPGGRRRPRPPPRGRTHGGLHRARGPDVAHRGTQRGLGARRRARPGPQGRCHRRAGRARRHDARLRPQLRLRPRCVRRDRAVRHHRRRRHQPHPGSRSHHRGHRRPARRRAGAQPGLLHGGAGMTAVDPGSRRLLRVEGRNAATPIEKKPPWIKTRLRTGPEYTALKSLVQKEGLHTVCEEAGCPNIFECWEDREATFLIGGDACTRRCDFCQIDTGKPEPLDRDEPRRVAESVRTMGLRYATVTGVARDDLHDEGAWLYAETVRQIHALNPGTGVELLAPDFSGRPELLQQVFDARPEVFAHNVETVPRIFKRIRPAFRYDRSLAVLTLASEQGLVTKSNLILGMGETRAEVSAAMEDLRGAGCDLLTITQYLRPTPRHHPVERWVKPEEFVALREEAEDLGFLGVMSGPLVRSSYRAGRLYEQARSARAGVREEA